MYVQRESVVFSDVHNFMVYRAQELEVSISSLHLSFIPRVLCRTITVFRKFGGYPGLFWHAHRDCPLAGV